MSARVIPDKIQNLYRQEEQLRGKATEFVSGDERIALHLSVVEHAMDLADSLRQVPTDDEDLKVIQILGMRTFNAFGASLKLALSGYSQNSASILRDILETAFLLDLFDGDRPAINRWRLADKKAHDKEFLPVRVREALDARYGHTGNKRGELYKMISELASHPTMKSAFMMRPQKDGDAVIGPFIERTALKAVLSEMGKLAMQVGEKLDRFFPERWRQSDEVRQGFARVQREWIAEFYVKKAVPKK